MILLGGLWLRRASKKAPVKPQKENRCCAKTETKTTRQARRCFGSTAKQYVSSPRFTNCKSNLINIVIARISRHIHFDTCRIIRIRVFCHQCYTSVFCVDVHRCSYWRHFWCTRQPAITFGLWTMLKAKDRTSPSAPFYWGAEFLGAMAAIVLMALTNGGFA